MASPDAEKPNAPHQLALQPLRVGLGWVRIASSCQIAAACAAGAPVSKYNHGCDFAHELVDTKSWVTAVSVSTSAHVIVPPGIDIEADRHGQLHGIGESFRFQVLEVAAAAIDTAVSTEQNPDCRDCTRRVRLVVCLDSHDTRAGTFVMSETGGFVGASWLRLLRWVPSRTAGQRLLFDGITDTRAGLDTLAAIASSMR